MDNKQETRAATSYQVNQDSTVEGYAVTYETYDMGQFYERVERSALENINQEDVRAVMDHDPGKLLARSKQGSGTLLLDVDERGLRYTFGLPDTTAGNDAKVLLQREDITGASWKFVIKRDSWEYQDDKPLHIIQEVEPILDISLVTYPASPHTSATLRSMDKFLETQNKQNTQEMEEKKTIPAAPQIMQRSSKDFNIIRAIKGAMGDKWEGLEGELCQEGIQLRHKMGLEVKPHTFYFPFAGDPTQRDNVVGTPGAGGDLVQTTLLQYVDALWPNTPMLNNVSRFDNLRDNVEFPREDAVPTLAWYGEQEAATVQTSTFDKVAMSPKRAAIAMAISNQLLRQEYSNGIQGRLQRQMQRAMATGLEDAILNGSGTANQPTGVYTRLNGGAQDLALGPGLTYDDLVTMETAVVSANVDQRTLAYVTGPDLAGKLKKERTDAGSGIFTVNYSQSLNSDLTANGYRLFTTTLSPVNTTPDPDEYSILFGDLAEIAVGYWGAPSIMVNPYTRMKESTVELYIEQFMDTNILRDEALVITQNVQL